MPSSNFKFDGKTSQPQTARVTSGKSELLGLEMTDPRPRDGNANFNQDSAKRFIKLVGTEKSNFIAKQSIPSQGQNNLLNNYYESLQR